VFVSTENPDDDQPVSEEATDASCSLTCVHRCAERFKRKHPEVTVQLQVENTRRCCQAVTRGHVDIAVVGGEIPHDLAHLLQVVCMAFWICPPRTRHVRTCCTSWPAVRYIRSCEGCTYV